MSVSFLETQSLIRVGLISLVISKIDVKGGLLTPDLHASQEHLPVSQIPVKSPLHLKNCCNLKCPRQLRDQVAHPEIPASFLLSAMVSGKCVPCLLTKHLTVEFHI